MTREQFDKTRFYCGMKARHNVTGKIHYIGSVDLEKGLVGLIDFEEKFIDSVGPVSKDELYWVDCKDCDLVR